MEITQVCEHQEAETTGNHFRGCLSNKSSESDQGEKKRKHKIPVSGIRVDISIDHIDTQRIIRR